MTSAADTRVEPALAAGEADQIAQFLDFYRETIAVKATGLSEEDAHRALLPSEMMTVAGLISHLRWVESYWFEIVLDGQPDEGRPYSEEDPDGDFRVDGQTLDQVLADYRAQCAISRTITARLAVDDTVTFVAGRRKGQVVNQRWILLHMIEETARHAGHLDIIRELLDGTTGD